MSGHDHPNPFRHGERIVFPNPLPVSGPAAPLPPGAPVGRMGVQYGTQQSHNWPAGDVKPIQVIDVIKAEALWRFSVFGNVLVTVLYGTSKGRAIANLLAPVVMTVPGQLLVTVVPRNDDGTSCVVTLTQATAGALSQARALADATAGAIDLDEGACRYVALTASTLTIAGLAVAVPALSTVPLSAASRLLTGSGFQEFEA